MPEAGILGLGEALSGSVVVVDAITAPGDRRLIHLPVLIKNIHYFRS
jgi:hypothetical protein